MDHALKRGALALVLALPALLSPARAADVYAPRTGVLPSYALNVTSPGWGAALRGVLSLAGPELGKTTPLLGALQASELSSLRGSRALSPLVYALINEGIDLDHFERLPSQARTQALAAAAPRAAAALREMAVELMVQAGNPKAHVADLMNVESGLGQLADHFSAYLSPEDLAAVKSSRLGAGERIAAGRRVRLRRRAQAMADALADQADPRVTERLVLAAEERLGELEAAPSKAASAAAAEGLRDMALDSGDARLQAAIASGLGRIALSGRHPGAYEAAAAIGLGVRAEGARLAAAKAVLDVMETTKGAGHLDRRYETYAFGRDAVREMAAKTRSPRVAELAVTRLEGMIRDNRSAAQRAHLADAAAEIRGWAGEKGLRFKALEVPPARSRAWDLLGLGRDNIVRTGDRGYLSGFRTHWRAAVAATSVLGALAAGLAAVSFPWYAAVGLIAAGYYQIVRALWSDHPYFAVTQGLQLTVFAALAAGLGGFGPLALAVMGAGVAGWLPIVVRSYRADRAYAGFFLSLYPLVLALAVIGMLRGMGRL